MKQVREWTIGNLENGARDGGDIFAVVGAKQKVSFNEIIKGIQVVEKSAYDLLRKERDILLNAVKRELLATDRQIQKLAQIRRSKNEKCSK